MGSVSVVIPVFNGAETIAAALDSVFTQSLGALEVIVYDDGSEDGSISVALAAGSQDGRLRLIRGDGNRGLARAMNVLVSSAHGEYIAIQEQDDLSRPERLAVQSAVLDGEPAVGVVSAIASLSLHGSEVGTDPPSGALEFPTHRADLVRRIYSAGCIAANPTLMFRRSLSSQHGVQFDEALRGAVDWRWMIDVAHLTDFAFVPEVLVDVQRSRTSASSDKEALHREMRRCVNRAYAQYRATGSPINTREWLRARSTVDARLARTRGVRRGIPPLLIAAALNPPNPEVWQTARLWAAAAARRTLGP